MKNETTVRKVKMKVLCIILVMAVAAVTGCGANTGSESEVKNVPLKDIQEAVKNAYGEDYIPSMQYDEAAVKELMGVQKDWYEEIIAEGPMISVHVDTFVAVKAKEGSTEDVEKALMAYKEKLVKDTLQYPMNEMKVKGSQVKVYGDYVFFIMLGMIPMDAEGEEALKAAEKQNQKAADAIEALLL